MNKVDPHNKSSSVIKPLGSQNPNEIEKEGPSFRLKDRSKPHAMRLKENISHLNWIIIG